MSSVFLLLSVAILALKTTAMVSDDRGKYRVLWKIGASNGRLGRSLCAQVLLMFFIPFIAPLLLNIPLYSALKILFVSEVGRAPATSVAVQLAAMSGVLLAVFALYFIVSFLVMWQDIKHHLRTESGN